MSMILLLPLLYQAVKRSVIFVPVETTFLVYYSFYGHLMGNKLLVIL